jgi:RAVE protein 1 C terminal
MGFKSGSVTVDSSAHEAVEVTLQSSHDKRDDDLLFRLPPNSARHRARASSWVQRLQQGAPPRLSTSATNPRDARVASFTFGGMSVLIVTISGVDDEPHAYVICAKTHCILQSLDLLQHDAPRKARIIALRTHFLTGRILVALDSGWAYTFLPHRANAQLVCQGAWEWCQGPVLDTTDVFSLDRGGEGDYSLSVDRVLVAHGDRLAVFDLTAGCVVAHAVWTTQMPAPVRFSDLSGDGHTMAVVLVGAEESCGVHTFAQDSGNKNMYKAGLFLAHSDSVTKISFLGCVQTTPQRFDDLLLTHSALSGAACTFSVNGWVPLTKWSTPSCTVVNWLRGSVTLTLGDLSNSSTGEHQTCMHHVPLAWIVELSFQGDHSALRLSRLTQPKRWVKDTCSNNVDVASSLFPAGAIVGDDVLSASERGQDRDLLALEATWPACDPLDHEKLGESTSGRDDVFFRRPSPPAELRLLVSHPSLGEVVVLDIPTIDYPRIDTVEMRDPRRVTLSLNQAPWLRLAVTAPLRMPPKQRKVHSTSILYESVCIEAKVCSDVPQRIVLRYREFGSMLLVPINSKDAIVSDASASAGHSEVLRRFRDESLISVPVSMPTIDLPSSVGTDFLSIDSLLWWNDKGGEESLILVAVSREGTLRLFELPQLHATLQPKLPRQLEPRQFKNSIDRKPCALDSQLSLNPELLLTKTPTAVTVLSADSVLKENCHPDAVMIGPGPEDVNENWLLHAFPTDCPPQSQVRNSFSCGTQSILPSREPNDAFEGLKPDLDSSGLIGLLPTFLKRGHAELPHPWLPNTIALAPISTRANVRYAILFHVSETILYVSRLSKVLTKEGTPIVSGHTWPSIRIVDSPCMGMRDSPAVDLVTVVEVAPESIVLAMVDRHGALRLAAVIGDFEAASTEVTEITCEQTALCRICDGPPRELIVRSFTSELMASMCRNKNLTYASISVWSAHPHLPRTDQVCTSEEGMSLSRTGMFNEFVINISSVVRGGETDEFVDAAFVASGQMETFPSLIAFTRKRLISFRKLKVGDDWGPHIEIMYGQIRSSRTSMEQAASNASWLMGSDPQFMFPHMNAAFQLAVEPIDQGTNLCVDGHPHSMILRICLDSTGVQNSLLSHVRGTFARICSEGKDSYHIQQPGIQHEDGFEYARSRPPPTMLPDSSDALHDLGSLQRLLLSKIGNNKRSTDMDFLTENAMGPPPMLASIGEDDLLVLWALCGQILDPPDYSNLDRCGQLFLFASSLYCKLQQLPSEIDGNIDQQGQKPIVSEQPTPQGSVPLHRRKAFDQCIAPAACLSALMSDCQSQIIHRCMKLTEHVDWEFARRMRFSFWIRSDAALRRICVEIARAEFQKERDVLQCALFFIVAGKMTTVKNLAAADRSDAGQKFFKFLNDHDFASERGRRVAEKNAYSLLRKKRYIQASVFFLLADPPFLVPALETIAMRIHDLDLAFLVSRLVIPSGAALGGGGSFRAVAVDTMTHNVPYREWNPRLTKESLFLLAERMLPVVSEIPAMKVLLLLWTNTRHEAWWCLTGILRLSSVTQVPYYFCPERGRPTSRSLNDMIFRATRRIGEHIDFASSPLIYMSSKLTRTQFLAYTMVTSRLLLDRGEELTALQLLLAEAVQSELYVASNSCTARRKNIASFARHGFDETESCGSVMLEENRTIGGEQSSMVNSLDAPLRPGAAIMTAKIGNSKMAEVPPQNKTNGERTGPIVAEGMNSCIFHEFDVAPGTPSISRKSPGCYRTESDFMDLVVLQRNRLDTPPSSHETDCNNTSSCKATAALDAKLPCRDENPVEYHKNMRNLSPSQSPDLAPPWLWSQWKVTILKESAARCVVKDAAMAVAKVNGDPSNLSNSLPGGGVGSFEAAARVVRYHWARAPLAGCDLRVMQVVPCDHNRGGVSDHRNRRLLQSNPGICSAQCCRQRILPC